ncbi:MAG: hypothetical protein RML12_03940 [Xanthomonadales bacterium]|nr:hypothetical protein [Xanthomonadales bacterium]
MLYFAIALALFSVRAVRLIVGLRRVTRPLLGLDQAAFAEEYKHYNALLQRQRILSHAWREFDESLIKPDDEHPFIRNPHEPRAYFNDQTIIEPVLHTRFFDSVPNHLTGFGILGTFVGLAGGVGLASGSLQSLQPEEIQGALSHLLSGAALAFLTSIAGLGCSLAFLVFERTLLGTVRRSIARWTDRLEACVELITPEMISLAQVREAKRQTHLLHRFNTDLAVLIGQEMRSALDDVVHKPLHDRLGQVIDAIDRLQSNQQQIFHDTIQRLADRFERQLTQSVASGFDQFVNRLNETALRMQNVFLEFESSQRGAQELLSSAVDSVRQALAQAAEQSAQAISTTMSGSLERIEEAARRLSADVDHASQRLRESGNALIERLDVTLQSLRDDLALFREVTAAQQKLAERFQLLLGELGSLHERQAEMRNEIVTSLQQLRAAAEQLGTAHARLAEIVDRATASVGEAAKVAQLLQQEVARVSQESHSMAALWQRQEQGLRQIDVALNRIFDQLVDGLDEYTRKVREFHSQLDSLYSKAMEGLQATIERHIEKLDDLVDRLDRPTRAKS